MPASPSRYVIACGGTGGHLFPGIAVAEVLRERGHEVMLIISEKAIDATAVAGREDDFTIETQRSVGLPSPLLSPKLPRFFLGFAQSVRHSRRLFRDFQPRAVLGMGGFTSTGPILAARVAGIPCFVHESNAIPGKANRLNARVARVALLGFPQCAGHFASGVRTVFTGTPVRASLSAPVDRSAALARFGFSDEPGATTILVMGGSQGARGVNDSVLATLPALARSGRQLRFIHQSGNPDRAPFEAAYGKAGFPAHVAPFLSDMQDAYALAELAICRSGASSLTELAHFGIASVLVPYPFAAEDHQTRNAEIFSRAGAAWLVPEATTEGHLADLLGELLRSPERMSAARTASRSLARRDAATAVADAIIPRE